MSTLAARILDLGLSALWLWFLVVTIRSGRLFGHRRYRPSRAESPGKFWVATALIGLFALWCSGRALFYP